MAPQSTCDKCNLSNAPITSKSVPSEHVSTSLPLSPLNDCIFFLGMNPGFHEDRLNRPFMGPSGEFVRRVLLQGNHLQSRCSVILSNCARCNIPTPEAKPNALQYSTCLHAYFLPDLVFALSNSRRLLIVCLGADSTAQLHRLFTRKTLPLTKAFSSPFRTYTLPTSSPTDPPRTFQAISTFHPAAVLRENNLIHPVKDHMQLVADWFSGTLPTPSRPTFIPPRSPIP